MKSPARNTLRGISVLMILLMLAGTFQGTAHPAAQPMNSGQLSERQGGQSFWKDPCTMDGFVFGVTAAGCMMGSIWSCLGSASALIKAWKYDDCFK